MKLSEPSLALALDIAKTLGFNMESMAELLPAGIAGIKEAMQEAQKNV